MHVDARGNIPPASLECNAPREPYGSTLGKAISPVVEDEIQRAAGLACGVDGTLSASFEAIEKSR